MQAILHVHRYLLLIATVTPEVHAALYTSVFAVMACILYAKYCVCNAD